LLDFRRKSEAIARANELVKSRATNLGENHFFRKAAGFADENSGRLGHSFDDQAVGIDRKIRVEVVQLLFSEGYIFHGRRGGSRGELGELVDPDPTHNYAGNLLCTYLTTASTVNGN